MNQNNENLDTQEAQEPIEEAQEPVGEQTPKEVAAENKAVGGFTMERVIGGVKSFGKAAWEYIRHAKIELILLVALIVVDLVTKALIGKYMYVGQSITLIPKFLHITYVQNTKAAFGSAFGLEKLLGDNGIRIVFLIITVLALGVFCYLLYRLRKRHIFMRVSIALIIGGAIGNFIDRLFLHYVRDFVEFEFFGLDLPWLGKTFPVFNVADMGLTVGVVIFLIYLIAIYKEPKAETAEASESEQTAENEESGKADEQNVEQVTSDQNESIVTDSGAEPPEENTPDE